MAGLVLDVRSGATVGALLGAFVEAGASLTRIERDLASLGPGPVPLAVRSSPIGSILRLHAPIESPAQLPWGQQRDRIALLAVDPVVVQGTLAVLELLARARALVRRQPPGEVELDALGGLDETAAAVALASAVASLGVPSIATTAIGIGCGTVATAFGDVDLPGPVVGEILHARRTIPLGPGAEVVDPLGAAFLAAMTDELPTSGDDEVDGRVAGAAWAGRGAVHTRDGDVGAVVVIAA